MKIVQIGTNSGFDTTNRFLKSYALTYDVSMDLVLLIEPLRKLNANIISNYQGMNNVHIENVAIVSNNDTNFVDFFCNFSKVGLDEHSSLSKSHLLYKIGKDSGHVEETVEKITVPCETIMSMLNRHFVKRLDILFIDAEGSDGDIIMSIDFASVSIHTIIYEDRFLETEMSKKIQSLLKDKGYSSYLLSNGDVIATTLDIYKNHIIHHLSSVYKSNFETKI